MKKTIIIIVLTLLCHSSTIAFTLADSSMKVKGFVIKVENFKTDSAQVSWNLPIAYRLGAFDFTEANMSTAEILRYAVNVEFSDGSSLLFKDSFISATILKTKPKTQMEKSLMAYPKYIRFNCTIKLTKKQVKLLSLNKVKMLQVSFTMKEKKIKDFPMIDAAMFSFIDQLVLMKMPLSTIDNKMDYFYQTYHVQFIKSKTEFTQLNKEEFKMKLKSYMKFKNGSMEGFTFKELGVKNRTKDYDEKTFKKELQSAFSTTFSWL